MISGEASARPKERNNLTAVCWEDGLGNVELRIYYHRYSARGKSPSGPTTAIIQTALTLPIYLPVANSDITNSTAAAPSMKQSSVWSGKGLAALAATYLKASGIHLYYVKSHFPRDAYSIAEVTWNATSGNWSSATSLPAVNMSSRPALAVSCVDDATTGQKIHLTYSNHDQQLATTVWSERNETWSIPAIIAPISELQNIYRVSSDIQITPGSPATPRLHFIFNGRPYSSVLSGNFFTQYVTASSPTAPKNRENGFSDPGLIAAATRNNKRSPVSQLFYVLREGGGVTIWNSTTSNDFERGKALATLGTGT